MYDGTEEILFPVDSGARYVFSVSCGEIARINTNMTSLSVLGWLGVSTDAAEGRWGMSNIKQKTPRENAAFF